MWHSFAFFILCRVGRLPGGRVLGRALGLAAHALMHRRRQVAQQNIAAALPGLSADEQQQLLKDHFITLGEWFMDSLWALSATRQQLAARIRINGELTQPCILLSPHFLGMDICSLHLSAVSHYPFFYYYKPQHNRFWDMVVQRQRERFGAIGFSTRSSYSLLHGVRRLRAGSVLCYFPDIDPGSRKSTVFVPFLGVAQAATATGIARVARAAKVPVVLAVAERNKHGYCFHLVPLAGFPDDCGAADATTMNEAIGKWVQQQPKNYYWLHRRFKTTAEDSTPVYR